MAHSVQQTSQCCILRRLLISLLTITLCAGNLEFPSDVAVSFLPEDPIIHFGGMLNLTCSILDHTSNYTAANITIKFKSKQNITKIVQTVDEYSVNLLVPNIKRDAFVQCHVDDKMGGMQSVRIIYPPEVSGMTCILQNWRNLSCSWQPRSQESFTLSKAKVFVLWTNKTMDGNWSEWIEHKTLDTGVMLWNLANYSQDELENMTFKVKIRVENILSIYESDEYTFFLPDLIYPDAVVNLAVNLEEKTSMRLSWSPTERSSSQPLQYRMTYISQWDPQPMVIISQESEVILEDLEPYTMYLVSVEAKYVVGRTWSVPVNSTFTTSSTGPDRSPELTPGSFEVKRDCGINCDHIFIYWKTLPIRLMRDSINNVDYELQLEANSSCLLTSRFPSPVYSAIYKHPIYSMNFTAQPDCDIAVSLSAWNRAGGPQHGPPSRMNILRESKWPKSSKLVVNAVAAQEGSDKDTVSLEWAHNDDSTKYTAYDYTVFWCLGSVVDHKCKNEISWASVPSPATNYSVVLPVGSTYHYIFGLAVQKEDASSGIAWSDCTYDNSIVSPSPSIELSQHQPYKGIRFHLTPPSCADLGGHIYSYLIHSCHVSGCPVSRNVSCLNLIQKDVISSDLITHTVTDLPPGEIYVVWVRSLSRAGKSPYPSNMICQVITQSWLTKWPLFGIIVGTIIGSALLIAGIISSIKYCLKFQHWYNKGVEITRPDKMCPELHLSEGPLCEETKLEETWTFDKQLSVESNISADSGRGSMKHPNGLRVSIADDGMDEVFLDEPLIEAGYVEVDDPYDIPHYLIAKPPVTPSDNYRHQNGHCGGPPKLVSSGGEPPQSKGPGHPVRNGFVRTSHSPHRVMPAVPLPKVEEEGSSCDSDRMDRSDRFTLPPMVVNPTYCEILPDDGGANGHVVS